MQNEYKMNVNKKKMNETHFYFHFFHFCFSFYLLFYHISDSLSYLSHQIITVKNKMSHIDHSKKMFKNTASQFYVIQAINCCHSCCKKQNQKNFRMNKHKSREAEIYYESCEEK